MAISGSKRCEGAFMGHILASDYDASIHLATVLSESLVQYKTFNPSNTFSQYLYVCHTKNSEFGNINKLIYKNSQNYISAGGSDASLTQNHFVFNQSTINEIVRLTDKQSNGSTAACGPAHRSFPLSLCPWISYDDLFEVTMREAALTHQSPIAGQTAGIINLICRSLLQEKSWSDAITLAFATSRLHDDVSSVLFRYSRSASLSTKTHPAYAPTALVAALHCVSKALSLDHAITVAKELNNFSCLPIVGILGGIRWGIGDQIVSSLKNQAKTKRILGTANDLGNLWDGQNLSIQL